MELELTRSLALQPEIRTSRRLVFYASVFDVPANVFENGETFTEVVKPGTFARSLAGQSDVYACLEHDASTTFSRRSSGLILQEDARGLFASCWLPETALGNRILSDVQAGRINCASFKFRDAPGGRQRSGSLHTVTDVTLLDVCLSYGKAIYPQTTVSIRSEQQLEANSVRQRLRLLKLRS